MTPADVIQAWEGKPFSYGVDCCQFAGEMVEAIHGWNPMARFDYDDEAEANAIIAGFGSLESAMIDTLGEGHRDPVESDVVVIDQTDGSQIAGVVFGGRIVVRTRDGLHRWPRAYARRAWSCRKS